MRRRPPILLAAVPCAVAAVAHACSGPGAGELIRANERLGWILFGVALLVVAAAAALLRHRGVAVRRLAWLAAPAILHPGWWMSARGGDCGHALRLGSLAMTAVAALAALAAVVVVLARRRRP